MVSRAPASLGEKTNADMVNIVAGSVASWNILHGAINLRSNSDANSVEGDYRSATELVSLALAIKPQPLEQATPIPLSV